MTGIFDSGVGGLTALEHLRILKPREDICYLADKENAPYGNKSESELLALVKKDIERLRSRGCDKILAACCTASTVIRGLPDSYRSGVVSIIAPSAREAVRLGAGRIGIIATEATVKSRAFENEILSLDGNIELRSVSAQPLVAMVESGERDGSCSDSCRGYLEGLLKTFSGCDLLILGCTHFTHLEKTVEAISGIKTLSPSRIGASVMAQRISGEGEGKTCYL